MDVEQWRLQPTDLTRAPDWTGLDWIGLDRILSLRGWLLMAVKRFAREQNPIGYATDCDFDLARRRA